MKPCRPVTHLALRLLQLGTVVCKVLRSLCLLTSPSLSLAAQLLQLDHLGPALIPAHVHAKDQVGDQGVKQPPHWLLRSGTGDAMSVPAPALWRHNETPAAGGARA